MLQSSLINDKPVWIREDQKRAIWYTNQTWNVGYVSKIGSDSSFFKSSIADNKLPNDNFLTWNYRFWTVLPFSNRMAINFVIEEVFESQC